MNKISGGYTGGETPVPIPNTEVKPARADDTATGRSWESRSLPELRFKKGHGSAMSLLFSYQSKNTASVPFQLDFLHRVWGNVDNRVKPSSCVSIL